MIGVLWRFTARAGYLILLVLFGLPFAALKWLLLGTRGGRERRKLLKLQRRQVKLAERQHRASRST